jgi:endonuclease YncB( thermonuclease family)
VPVLLTLVLAAGLVLELGGLAAVRAAARDPLRGQGVVTSVADGDTVRVRLDGSNSDPLVRLNGIQAFETGECGADLATSRLRQLVQGHRVELRSRSASSTSDGRPLRSLHRGGTDVSEQLLSDGMGLWFPIGTELTDTVRYHRAADEARAAGRGIWRDDLCGRGPGHGVPIEMWVKSDADSNDPQNVNGEYVVVVNRDPTRSLDLSDWSLRDSSQMREIGGPYRFPPGTVVSAGGRVRVHVGRGTDTAATFHMGSPSPIFDNADWATGSGDGAYLSDPRGNVRAAFTYPWTIDCSSPLAGALRIDHVEYDPPGVDTADTEFVRLRNVSTRRVHLDGHQLRKLPYAHEFLPDTHLDPGETLTVVVGRGTSTRLRQFWGSPGNGPILANAGDVVEILTWDERVVDCRSWGVRSCFRDVDATAAHGDAIREVAAAGVAGGYADRTYRPKASVTRAQMATFITRARGLTPTSRAPFPDVPGGDVHAGAIGAVAAAGIADGYPDGTYRPGRQVTRGQMATFLAAAAGLPPVRHVPFTDVPADHAHAGAIGAVAAAGIALGSGGRFEPNGPVTRAQMASFLDRLPG